MLNQPTQPQEQMLDRIIMAIAFALFEYLSKRIEQGRMAVDSTVDIPRLRRAGSRIDEWMRQQNNIGAGGKPNQTGTQL